MNACITASRLTVRFSGNPVLDHISFEVPEGMIFGLLGPFGASIYRQPPQHRIKQGF